MPNFGPGLVQPGATPLDVAFTQLGVTEIPLGSNRGPQVDQYLRAVGLDPSHGSYPWCAAFVYWCHAQAGVTSPKIAGVLHLWESSTSSRVAAPTPGCVFVHLDPGGHVGHVGFVESVNTDGTLNTIEGNTNAAGSREGDRVARKLGPTARPANYAIGFLKFY